jgi:hypothetical protein
MATCKGKRPENPNGHCGGTLYKCGKCGSVGCGTTVSGKGCSNNGFKTGTCQKCGTPGQAKPI